LRIDRFWNVSSPRKMLRIFRDKVLVFYFLSPETQFPAVKNFGIVHLRYMGDFFSNSMSSFLEKRLYRFSQTVRIFYFFLAKLRFARKKNFFKFGGYSWTVVIFLQARIFMFCTQRNKNDCKSNDSVSIFNNIKFWYCYFRIDSWLIVLLHISFPRNPQADFS